MRSVLLGVALSGLVSCGAGRSSAEERQASETALQSEAAFEVRLEKNYGFCRGDCTQSLSVSSDGTAEAEVVTTDGNRRTRQFTVRADALAALRSSIGAALAQP